MKTVLGILFFAALPFAVLAAIPLLIAVGPLLVVMAVLGGAAAVLKRSF